VSFEKGADLDIQTTRESSKILDDNQDQEIKIDIPTK
jgi:hypothetical protein